MKFLLVYQIALITLAIVFILYGILSNGPLAEPVLVVGIVLAVADGAITLRSLVHLKRNLQGPAKSDE